MASRVTILATLWNDTERGKDFPPGHMPWQGLL